MNKLPSISTTKHSSLFSLQNYLSALLLGLSPSLYASDTSSNTISLNERQTTYSEHGFLVFDYEVISLADKGKIDLFGTRYLHQMNDWFYLGFGLHAPLIEGNYGGFMTVDASLHAQKNLSKQLFINGGLTFGGGGGGSSVKQSIELSGTGGFWQSYIGLGYQLESGNSIGVNYTDIQFKDSQIDNSQLNLFMQIPLHYQVNSYSDSGLPLHRTDNSTSKTSNSILSFELNNIVQIDPTASNKGTINTVALQFSHFFQPDNYLFMEADIGYKGRPLYNQFVHGVGHQFSLSANKNLYTQIGIGSGGYAPSVIDTGAGLLVYPKVAFEYLVTKNLGLSLSGGYLTAPTGTSKNYTLGASLNYHLDKKRRISDKKTYQGFRMNFFQQSEFNVNISGEEHHNINMLSSQFDSQLSKHWYLANQVSVAYNDFRNYPGYGEILAGLGLQTAFNQYNRLQGFAQMLLGANIHGIIAKPAVGINYSFSDRYALFAQYNRTKSVNHGQLYRADESFKADAIGLGLTYRFAL